MLPPRRPERPIVPVTHARSDIPKVDIVGCTLSSTLEKDATERSNDIVMPFFSFLLIFLQAFPIYIPLPWVTLLHLMMDNLATSCCGDLEGFDSVVPTAEKLSHPTTTRPKATGRRPPSQSFTSSSLSSPDFFDSPSPEDEKEEHISLPHKVAEPLKKAKTVTISLVSDNKASLPAKPGSLISGSNVPSLLSSSSSAFHSVSVGTAGHRSNSPSLFSTEGKPKTDQSSQSESALEELRTQVKELRTIIETMKDQQKKEIKQLLSELDEEKKIRLRLQMEVNDIKKALQSK
uniref:SH3 domain-containing kinase-binding protein 1 n=1 Tax=Sphaerodactylus townsendi TaxID=933632 RepID=A0ACB8FIJ3_9SAUR